MALEARMIQMTLQYNTDVEILWARTLELNERLSKFEDNPNRAKVMERRVAEIRADVDDLNDRVKVFEESDDTTGEHAWGTPVEDNN